MIEQCIDCAPLTCHILKKRIVRNKRDIWDLSNCNETQTNNHLIHKRTLNYLVKLVKWLSSVVITYLYSALKVCFYHALYTFRVNLHSVIA